MSRTLLVCCAAAVAVLSIPAAAKDAPIVLQPSSKWNIDYNDDSCRLGRKFGEGEQFMFFYLERFEPGDTSMMVVAGKPLGDWSGRRTDFTFGPNGQQIERASRNGVHATYGPTVIVDGATLMPWDRIGKPDILEKADDAPRRFEERTTPEQERSIEWLDIQPSGRKPIRLALGAMDKPMAAMRACTDELITHWGLDLDAIRGMTRGPKPRGSVGSWVTTSDYPREALRNGEGGLVHFRLIVGTDGNPVSCHVQHVTDPAVLGEAACNALMRNARFEPALGADGRPIVSYWRTTVSFVL